MSQNPEVFTFAEIWKQLFEGIQRIYQFQAMTQSNWMQLYT
jgi:hypothetical protein